MLTKRLSVTGLFYYLYYISQSSSLFAVDGLFNDTVNDRPIIGILAQELSYRMKETYGDAYNSYIAASYVKFLESGGARVVPVWIGQNQKYYDHILSQINGILFPGGAVFFNSTNGYVSSAKKVYSAATKMNAQGDYFPIFGICLGFEVMTYIAAGREFREPCNGLQNVARPLKFKPDFRNSRLYKNSSQQIIHILRHENVTSNFHKFCVTEHGLAKVNLSSVYRVITVNNDSNGLVHVSSIEHFNFPFYGVQFHPEKNSFEWADRLSGIPHSSNATKISQYFANFFVDEARKNHHTFSSKKEEIASLIYNYAVFFTASNDSSFDQTYFFHPNNTSNL